MPFTGSVSLTYIPPPDDLADKFGALYRFVADKPQVSDHTRAELAQLRFMLSGKGHYVFGDGRSVETPEVCLLGPTNMATHFHVDGPLHVLGVGILPLGWIAMGLGDASEVAENLIDMAGRHGARWKEMLTRLHGVEDVEEAASMVWDLLRGSIHPVREADQLFIATVDGWLTDKRSPKISELQAATGLSARQISRLCNRYYGASPKYLARKYRALRCAHMIALDQADWVDCCAENFYDQSHFIREIKHFIGLTPSQLRDNASIVMRMTLGRRDVASLAPLSKLG